MLVGRAILLEEHLEHLLADGAQTALRGQPFLVGFAAFRACYVLLVPVPVTVEGLSSCALSAFLRNFALEILVVPALPSGTDRLKKIFIKIKSFGLTGVFTLRSILENLLKQTHPSQSAESRKIFQFLRLFKVYGLSRDPQLEIFPEE